MAEKTEFLQAIDDAILDADSLERFINGPDSETVLTRLSAEYPTLQKAIKQMFENGGIPATPFETKALMESSELTEGSYAVVTNDSIKVNNGLYLRGTNGFELADYNLNNKFDEYVNNNAYELKRLIRDALKDPFRHVKIKLLGDSITWGMGSSAGSPITPRTGDLSDVRNTTDYSSKTWANLVRQWIAYAYGDTQITEDAPGSAYTRVRMDIGLDAHHKQIKFIANNNNEISDDKKLGILDTLTGLATGKSVNLLSKTYNTTSRPNILEFEIVGDNITLLFQKVTGVSATSGDKIEVFVDGVSVGTADYHGTSPNNREEATFEFDYGKHTIRVQNISEVASSYVRFSGFRVDKKIWVINEGIIGLSAKTMLSRNILEDTLKGEDDLIILMIGTNDRQENGGVDTFYNDYNTCIDKINQLSPSSDLVLMSSTYVVNENPTTYNFPMSEVDRITNLVARERGLYHISQYKATAKARADGVGILSDGLHLNDAGNKVYASEVIDKLFDV